MVDYEERWWRRHIIQPTRAGNRGVQESKNRVTLHLRRIEKSSFPRYKVKNGKKRFRKIV